MTTAPETAPAGSNGTRPDGPSPEQRAEMLRGRILTVENALRITGGAHRLAYVAVIARDVVLNRIRHAETLDEVREALDSLEDAGWSDEALPVDDETRAALAEHLWQHCQRHPHVPGALFEDPRRTAHYAIDFLRALWRLPGPDGAEPTGEYDPGDEVEPATYAEAIEAHRVLRERRRREMDERALVWDAAEADAVARIERLTPDEPDEETTGDVGGEQPAENDEGEQQREADTAPHAWADKWQGERETLREQLEAGVTDDPEFVGRVICPEGTACPRGIVATFRPRADGSVPMHRYDVGGEECAGVGAKPEPLRLAGTDEEQGAPDA